MTSEPPRPDQVTLDFYALIGAIIICWGRIERALDIALIGGRPFSPKHFPKGEQPLMFKSKIKALRAVCKNVPTTAGNMKWINDILNELVDLSEDRHTIVHGHFHGIRTTRDAGPMIYFRRAPPLSGDAGQRFLKTKPEVVEYIRKLEKADRDFLWIMLTLRDGYHRKVN